MRAVALDSQSVALEPGEPFALDDREMGYEVASGRVEIYASLGCEGEAATRHFLFEVAAGELIAPQIAKTDDLRLIALALEATVLNASTVAQLAAPAAKAISATTLDAWIGRLASAAGRLLGPPPTDAIAAAAGQEVTLTVNGALTLSAGVAWVVGARTEFAYCGIRPIYVDADEGAAVAPGVWLTAAAPARLKLQSTPALLAMPQWPRRLGGVHGHILGLVADALRSRQDAKREAIESRVSRTQRTMQRALGRFDSVLGRTAARGVVEQAKDEPFVAPFVIVAAELGVELATRQRDLLARSRTIDSAARAVRLRNRAVALRGNWRREDLGPLIGFLDEEHRPVALTKSSGRWHMIEAEGARPVLVDGALAARLGGMAHMLYAPLPERAVGFREFISFGFLRNRADVLVAAAMAIAGALLGLATPLAMQLAFDRFIPGHEISSLAELALGLTLAAVIAAAFRVVYDIAVLRIDGRSAGMLQAAIVDRVLRLPGYTLRMSPGDLASRVTSGDGLRRSVYATFLGSLSALFFWITNIGMMFYYSPAAAGVSAALFALLTGLAVTSGQWQLKTLLRGEELMADIYSIVFQLVQGISVLRAGGAEQRAFARWAMDFAELRARSYRARAIATMWETALAAFELLALATILWVISRIPREQISTGVFISFISAYGAYMGASLQIARGAVAAWNAKPSWTRAAPLLRAAPEGAASRRDPGKLTGAIDLTGVYFRYGVEGALALQGISLSIAPGEFVALVGRSGSGKSTLMRLLLGFEQPLSGAVQYDHQDLRFLDIELVRRQIGVVLQNSTLFPGTLYENIMAATEGTMDDAWTAARQAGVAADIKAMPMGMHTVVTEASSAFSGGQIQRFAIARALVGKPRILLLDEATSALDNVTQAIVTDSLERLAVTRLVIAHRLSTVKKAGRIVVIDHGKVAQTGKFEQLVAAPGPFAELARRQLL
jgi:NHLM bacteriocin system ABC transporter ATP-binding protein